MTDGLVIEPAGAEALAGIMVVMNAAFPPDYGEAWTAEQCRTMLVFPGSTILVARIDATVCGFAFVRTVLDEAELLMIAVHPGQARRGVGKLLLNTVVNHCYQLGVKQVHLEVREDNEIAKNLYIGDNFSPSGIRKGYYRGLNGTTANSITYCKELV